MAEGYGEIVVSEEYFQATISLTPKALYSKQNLNATICHELLHLLTAPLASFSVSLGPRFSDDIEKLEEQLITRLEKILSG